MDNNKDINKKMLKELKNKIASNKDKRKRTRRRAGIFLVLVVIAILALVILAGNNLNSKNISVYEYSSFLLGLLMAIFVSWQIYISKIDKSSDVLTELTAIQIYVQFIAIKNDINEKEEILKIIKNEEF